MGLRMKNFGGSLKNPIFLGGGVHEKPIYRWELPKKEGAWTVCRFRRGLAEKEEEGVFERGWALKRDSNTGVSLWTLRNF